MIANVSIVKVSVLSMVGAVGTFIASLFGGWSEALTALCVFIIIDYVTGLLVAGVFKNSPKTESGALSSKVAFKGLCEKAVMLLLVAAVSWAERLMHVSGLQTMVIIGFCSSEFLSIAENAGLMGVPIGVLANVIDLFKKNQK